MDRHELNRMFDGLAPGPQRERELLKKLRQGRGLYGKRKSHDEVSARRVQPGAARRQRGPGRAMRPSEPDI